MFEFSFTFSDPMRLFVSLFAVGCLSGIVFVSGCDRPEREMPYYGKISNQLPDLPEVKEPFDLPEIEGVDREELMKKRY